MRDLGSSFELGRIYTSGTIYENVARNEVDDALDRHARADWGDGLTREGHNENDETIKKKISRPIRSCYSSSGGMPFWIITSSDRSETLALLGTERRLYPEK